MSRFLLIGSFCLTFVLMGSAAEKPAPRNVMKKVARDNNAFAFNLYGKLREQPGNLFFSPDSISLALAMTYDGARGQTAEQMARTMHFTLDREQLNEGFGTLLNELNGEGKKRAYELHVANALWGQKGHRFLPPFLDTSHKYYGAGLRLVDFTGNAEASRQAINQWVEQETHNKIRDLLPQGSIDDLTRLVLTNAIYFKGTWQRQFKKALTHDGPFLVSTKERVQVPMMHQEETFRYLKDKDAQVLEMPYQGNDLSMVVVLPRRPDGLNHLESTLNPEKLDNWLARARPMHLLVSLPRFKLTKELSLGDVLSSMGMPLAFSAQADFSGMDGEKDLHISAVLHKAFVDVNEEGTEAAAATGAIMTLAAMPVTERFQADHPFIFLIRDNHSGSVLFLGRVVNPAK